MPFPSPPWTLHGQAWVSLFYATPPAPLDPEGEGLGVYAAAFASFETGSTVPHRALVLARRVRDDDGRAYRVVDGWADAAAALDGYASLFGFPVRAGSLDVELGGLGPVGRSEWRATAVADAQNAAAQNTAAQNTAAQNTAAQIAAAQFADTAGVALRTRLTVVTRQPRRDGPPATATLSGSARSLPCLAVWSVPADGPLSWLARKQPFASFRLRDATLSLG